MTNSDRIAARSALKNNATDFSQPPSDVPDYLKFLLGLPSDATREQLANEWSNQVVPLLNSGPIHLFQKEAMALMAAGIPGEQARRLYKATKRGQQLWNAADREGKIRARLSTAKPPFLQKQGPITAAKSQSKQ